MGVNLIVNLNFKLKDSNVLWLYCIFPFEFQDANFIESTQEGFDVDKMENGFDVYQPSIRGDITHYPNFFIISCLCWCWEWCGLIL